MDGYLKEPQLNQAMCYQNKIIAIISVFLILGCSEINEKSSKLKQTKEKDRNDAIVNFTNKPENHDVYLIAKDSLSNWCRNKLSTVLELNTMGYQLDSVICLNSKKNKFIGAILIPCTINDCKQDDIRFFYGSKINKKWYYFFGPTIVLPQDKPQTPRSFHQLHAIAMKEVFRGYLKKNANGPSHGGEWEINEAFFDRIEFQYEKWAYWDTNGNLIDNKTIGKDSLQKLYLNRIIYDKYK